MNSIFFRSFFFPLVSLVCVRSSCVQYFVRIQLRLLRRTIYVYQWERYGVDGKLTFFYSHDESCTIRPGCLVPVAGTSGLCYDYEQETSLSTWLFYECLFNRVYEQMRGSIMYTIGWRGEGREKPVMEPRQHTDDKSHNTKTAMSIPMLKCASRSTKYPTPVLENATRAK